MIFENDNIKTDDNIIINIVNGGSGFGSQLTLIMQYISYFNELNNKIICLPQFNNNIGGFKYHDNNYNNSFFIYFKKKDIHNLKNYKKYFVLADLINNYPFFTPIIPPIENEINNKYITMFINNYEFIKNENTNKIEYELSNVKKPLYGIHIRSIAQKQFHHEEYLSISIDDRLLKLKEKLDIENKEYSIYIASDVNLYIEKSKSIFKDILYITNITRINEEDDIMMKIEDGGYKLGSDILNECYGLSLCNKIYVSNSNIPVIVSIFNKNISMEEY